MTRFAATFLLLAVGASLASGPASAQDPGPVVVVLSGSEEPYRKAEAGLRAGLERSGLPIVTLSLDAAFELRGEIPANARAVVAIGTRSAQKLVGLLPSAMPLGYCLVADPEGLGLDERPVTAGVGTLVPIRAQVDLLREALPGCQRLGLMYRAEDEASRRFVAEVGAALGKDLALEAVAIDRHANPAEAIEALLGARVDAVLTQADSVVYDHACIRSLLLKSVRRQVPVFGFSNAFVRAGALIGVGIDASEQGRHAAQITLQLLAAGEPAAPAPAQPPRFRVFVNLRVAERLGIRMPKSVLERAQDCAEDDK